MQEGPMKDDVLLAEVLRKLGLAVLERQPHGVFTMRTVPPTWLRHAFQEAPLAPSPTLSGALPFLDYFLPEAQRVWDAGGRAAAETGLFTAEIDGDEILLRARAITVAGRPLAILERMTGEADARPNLQLAREHLLESEKLVRRIRTADASAAALAGPISALLDTDLTPDQRRLVDDLSAASAAIRAALKAP